VYPVDIGDAFSEVEFCVFDAVAAFDFDERCGGRCVAFGAREGDVLSSHVESELARISGNNTCVVPRALLWRAGGGGCWWCWWWAGDTTVQLLLFRFWRISLGTKSSHAKGTLTARVIW